MKMLQFLMIISLGLLLQIAHSSTKDLHLQKYEGSSINYTTCEVTDAHDEPDYKDYLGEGCHYTHYEAWKKIEEEFPGVRSCCPFHGHISSAKNCQGKDKEGKEAVFNVAEVCVKPIEGEDNKVVEKMNLNCRTKTVKGVFDRKKAYLSTENNVQVLQVGQKTFTNFCFGIQCDSNDANFEHQYEACEETIARIPVPLEGTRCCGKTTVT